MSCAEDVHEGEVATALDSSGLLAIGLEVFHFSLVKGLLSWPLEGLSPSMISKNILKKMLTEIQFRWIESTYAKYNRITSINEDWNLLEYSRNQTMEGLHPVAGQTRSFD